MPAGPEDDKSAGLCAVHADQQARLRARVAARAPEHPGAGPIAALLAVVGSVDRSWHGRAACRGMTGTMFPLAPDRRPPAYGPAIAICARCPVVGPCRTAGASERDGVWGATTPADRRSRRRRRPSASSPG
ncbi:MAG: WhiB family transcriptional regulator [Acidimicrobiales bacterium]